ncbi:hypothetical protein ILYODFUR_015645 [Ilyodon furcidens]|uniref:Uncharacterized protein n=1 Tax=Ilyodon furcidens TaxID=33524 RepID=A0ABV0T888_9TELE
MVKDVGSPAILVRYDCTTQLSMRCSSDVTRIDKKQRKQPFNCHFQSEFTRLVAHLWRNRSSRASLLILHTGHSRKNLKAGNLSDTRSEDPYPDQRPLDGARRR